MDKPLIDFSKSFNELSSTEVHLLMVQEEHALIAIRAKALEKRREKLKAELDAVEEDIHQDKNRAMWLIKETMRLQMMRERELKHEHVK